MLTDIEIRKAKPEAKARKLRDGGGLYLDVRPTGSKFWRYRYRLGGAEQTYTIGEYPGVSLQGARSERDRARGQIRQGVHPGHERARTRSNLIAENANTFETIAKEWIQGRKAHWSAYYLKQVESYLAGDVYPKIGRRPIRSINSADVLDVLNAVAGRGAEAAAINMRQWISAIFRFAVATLRAENDPAAPLRGAIRRPPIQNASPKDQGQICDFLKRLRAYGGNRTTAIALELLLILFVRTVELRTAPWSEFDLKRGLWAIPGSRMKRRRTHLVPLPEQAVRLLQELQEITGAGVHLFPNMRRPKDVMSATTVNRALEHMGYPSGFFTGHDFRATASTRLHEMGYRSELVELQLAHAKTDKVAAAYNHAEYLGERVTMMQAWADWLDGQSLPK